MQFADHRSRRLAGGASLLVGPALILAGFAMQPGTDPEAAAWVADVAAAPGRAAASLTLVAIGTAVSLFAYLSLVHMLRERRPVLGDVGGALAIVGGASMLALMGAAIAEVEAIRELAGAASAETLVDAIDSSVAMGTLFVGAILGTVGVIVLAAGLYAAQTTPWPLSIGLGLGSLVLALGMFGFQSFAWVIVGAAITFLAMGGIGIQLIAETDEDWEHAPTFQGFRPVTGS
jgi:hypothetical protein